MLQVDSKALDFLTASDFGFNDQPELMPVEKMTGEEKKQNLFCQMFDLSSTTLALELESGIVAALAGPLDQMVECQIQEAGIPVPDEK